MKNAKHTIGPWSAGGGGDRTWNICAPNPNAINPTGDNLDVEGNYIDPFGDGELYLAMVFRDDENPAESGANAYLMAAAPKMLEALEESLFLFAHGVGALSETHHEHNMNEAKRIQNLIRTAIAEAKGDNQCN